MAKILVVDDEKVLVKGIKFNLENEGYEVEVGHDGEQAVELARNGGFDLVILDLMMPKIDGLQACMRIREFSNVPVIMLTARSEDTDKIIGFECGADDYITKPFSPKELVFRVKAQLRRLEYNKTAEAAAGRRIRVGGLEIDVDGSRVYQDGRELGLTAREFGILLYLAENAGKIISKDRLYEQVWGELSAVCDNTIMVHIRHLREKIEKDPSRPALILTVKGLGYRMAAGTGK